MINLGSSYHKFTFHLDQINQAAKDMPLQLINQMEAAFQSNISSIADEILLPESNCKVIMLSGPSSSGKTTTAHKLMAELKKRGAGTTVISLDDFYLGREKAPLLPDGKRDYEAVEALNLAKIQECLLSLMKYGFCDKPNFDFPNNRPHSYTTRVELGEHDVAIVEGIHALNPIITDHLPCDNLIKLYISVKQGIKDDEGTVLSPREIRFLRRMVRDYRYRGVQPERTFSMWSGVCRGEDLYIRPFQKTSDITINSIHMYEPCVLCHDALPLLKSIQAESEHFMFASGLIKSLQRFYPIDNSLVPRDSLLREFIGGGMYE